MTLAMILPFLAKIGTAFKALWTAVATAVTLVFHQLFSSTDDNKVRRIILFALLVLSLIGNAYQGFFQSGNKLAVPLNKWKPFTTIVQGGSTHPVAASPVTQWKDRIVYLDAQGQTIIAKVYPEGKTVRGTKGEVYTQTYGVCFNPKLGVIVAAGDSIQPAISARLLWFKYYGVEVMASRYRAGVGIDRRLPEIGFINLLISLGYSVSYGIKDHTNNSLYLGLGAGTKY